jgi:(4-alkanoyl-5-oxo-2,5-dihydrofuran-3-yl)methyl phosphate reductase
MSAPQWPGAGQRSGRSPGLRIAVTGAAGTVGGLVARMLAPGHWVRSLTRDPDRALRAGVAGQVVGADLAELPGLKRAVAGADALLAVTFDPLGPVHDENLLAAARAGGVRHVVKLSALAVTDPDADDLITRWQRECEERLRAAGTSWTLLRPRAFMSNSLGWAASVRDEGVVRTLHGASRNSCVDPLDVARAAALSLTRPGHAGRAHALTGPGALSAVEQTEQLARGLGRPLRHEELTEEQAADAWRSRFSEPLVQALVASAERQAQGAKAQVTGGVAAVTGREPATFQEWAARHTAAFRTPALTT